MSARKLTENSASNLGKHQSDFLVLTQCKRCIICQNCNIAGVL